ncbi:hypothetical protein MJN71_05470, partial [Salmonella enterica subsp. enterica serovar Cerro]|nr:hypothetical protein [Salmonella enterica subsp. enterica serovar Cerro]
LFPPFLGLLTIFFPNNQQKALFFGGKRYALTACTSRCHHALPIPYLSLFRSVLFLPSDCIFL